MRPARSCRRAVLPSLALALALGLLSGCGDDGRVPLHPAEGSVMVDGAPAEGVQVTLYPAEALDDLDALRPRGTTAADGSFALGTYEPGDGAPAGRYVVTLFWPDVPPGPTPPNDLLAGAHARPQDSELTVTIDEGPTQLEPFLISAPPRRAVPSGRHPPGPPDPDGMSPTAR